MVYRTRCPNRGCLVKYTDFDQFITKTTRILVVIARKK
jgi:hypothetical protein